ncbi:ZIP family metal transporter [Catenovulum sediminis]|uniref:ZIP family metal transporter n=1 Tax=Catenovulum sediminis TaxID=1740262 RepID=UPI00117F5AED|nr:hypothetical protein [Catenovulum sediminis]
MQASSDKLQTSLIAEIKAHTKQQPLAAAGLSFALLVVVTLLIQSSIKVSTGEFTQAIAYALLGGMAGFITTSLGALPALFLSSIPRKMEDIMLGMAAGMMLAASAFSLLLPGIEAGEAITNHAGLGAGVGLSSGMALAYPAGLGLAAGAMLFVVSHEVIPETHRNGHQTSATIGLMIGFAIMKVLDTTLG